MSSPAQEVIYASAKQYLREPVNLALLLIIPPLLIVAMSGALSTFSNVIGGNLGQRAGSGLAGLWAAAILTGVASFFLSLASACVDGRLILAGLRPSAVTAAHAAMTILIALLTAAVSVLILLATQDVGRLAALFGAIFVAALIYGSLGSLLSVYVHGDLEGSFVIILIFMLDAFVGGPLAAGRGIAADLLPVHFPSEVAIASMIDAPIHDSWLVWSGLYLVATSLLATYALMRRRTMQ
ncbi:MAG: hypothetical protein GEU75_14955 [Dehalococcoidia bacterium]|nr:hypothetical protein [Dehalococcoidia bacterium]